MSERTARELFAESLRLLLAKDMTGYVELWAADGSFEFPFAPPGYPQRLDGRQEIHDYLHGYPDLLDVHEITSQTVHETADPDVIVVEFEAVGKVVATGGRYTMRYIAVITARDGEIVNYRDYWSPLAAADVLADMKAAFTAEATA